jgi:hypothetical protein
LLSSKAAVDTIPLRWKGAAALIQYRSLIELAVHGQAHPRAQYWHADAFEKRDARRQVVWSHATRIM